MMEWVIRAGAAALLVLAGMGAAQAGEAWAAAVIFGVLGIALGFEIGKWERSDVRDLQDEIIRYQQRYSELFAAYRELLKEKEHRHD